MDMYRFSQMMSNQYSKGVERGKKLQKVNASAYERKMKALVTEAIKWTRENYPESEYNGLLYGLHAHLTEFIANN